MSASRHTLEVSYPVEGPEGLFLVRRIAGSSKIQSFHRSQSRSVTITAFVGRTAAECLAISLFSGDRCAIDNIFRPLRSGLYPFDQLARMFAPIQVFIWIQQDVASVLERDNLVHVSHAGRDVFEIA